MRSYAEGVRYCTALDKPSRRWCGQHAGHEGAHSYLVREGLDERGAVIARKVTFDV